MAASSSSMSLRLPQKTRRSLDKAAKITGQSRAAVVKQLLDRHLPAIISERTRAEQRDRFARILAMAGTGARYSTFKSADEVIKQIREFRGDE